MAAYLDLLPEVLPEVPGCTDLLAEREIRTATIRLCELSDIIKHTSEPVNIIAGEPRYPIEVPGDYAVSQVLWVTVDGGPPLKAHSQDYLDLAWREENLQRALFSHYHTQGFRGEPRGWRVFEQDRPEVYFIERQSDGDRIRLVGIPSRDHENGLQYQVSLKPLRTSSGVADFVVEDHYKLIAKGAIAELLCISKKPWTDLPRGRALREEFETDCSRLKRDSLNDFTRDDQAIGRTRTYP